MLKKKAKQTKQNIINKRKRTPTEHKQKQQKTNTT